MYRFYTLSLTLLLASLSELCLRPVVAEDVSACVLATQSLATGDSRESFEDAFYAQYRAVVSQLDISDLTQMLKSDYFELEHPSLSEFAEQKDYLSALRHLFSEFELSPSAREAFKRKLKSILENRIQFLEVGESAIQKKKDAQRKTIYGIQPVSIEEFAPTPENSKFFDSFVFDSPEYSLYYRTPAGGINKRGFPTGVLHQYSGLAFEQFPRLKVDDNLGLTGVGLVRIIDDVRPYVKTPEAPLQFAPRLASKIVYSTPENMHTTSNAALGFFILGDGSFWFKDPTFSHLDSDPFQSSPLKVLPLDLKTADFKVERVELISNHAFAIVEIRLHPGKAEEKYLRYFLRLAKAVDEADDKERVKLLKNSDFVFARNSGIGKVVGNKILESLSTKSHLDENLREFPNPFDMKGVESFQALEDDSILVAFGKNDIQIAPMAGTTVKFRRPTSLFAYANVKQPSKDKARVQLNRFERVFVFATPDNKLEIATRKQILKTDDSPTKIVTLDLNHPDPITHIEFSPFGHYLIVIQRIDDHDEASIFKSEDILSQKKRAQ